MGIIVEEKDRSSTMGHPLPPTVQYAFNTSGITMDANPDKVKQCLSALIENNNNIKKDFCLCICRTKITKA